MFSFKILGLSVGKECVEILKNMDTRRIQVAENQILELHKKARQAKAKTKINLEELYEEQEDPENPSYASGHY